MTSNTEEAAEELHPEIMGILKGEMGLTNPIIEFVGEKSIAIVTAKHRADALCAEAEADDYEVVGRVDLEKQPRDMTTYTSIELRRE